MGPGVTFGRLRLAGINDSHDAGAPQRNGVRGQGPCRRRLSYTVLICHNRKMHTLLIMLDISYSASKRPASRIEVTFETLLTPQPK